MRRPKLKRDWAGLKVRSLIELKNGLYSIPAGRIFTVTENHGGLKLKASKCHHCGVSLYITKVSEHDVESVDEASP